MHTEPQHLLNRRELCPRSVALMAFVNRMQAGGSTGSPSTGPGRGRSGDSVPTRLCDQWVAPVSDPKLRLSDVPLIVEDLLIQVKQLAHAGAAPEMIAELLDHVAALREGRG